MEGWFVIISHIEACTFRQKFSNKKKESKKMDVNWIYDNIYYITLLLKRIGYLDH